MSPGFHANGYPMSPGFHTSSPVMMPVSPGFNHEGQPFMPPNMQLPRGQQGDNQSPYLQRRTSAQLYYNVESGQFQSTQMPMMNTPFSPLNQPADLMGNQQAMPAMTPNLPPVCEENAVTQPAPPMPVMPVPTSNTITHARRFTVQAGDQANQIKNMLLTQPPVMASPSSKTSSENGDDDEDDSTLRPHVLQSKNGFIHYDNDSLEIGAKGMRRTKSLSDLAETLDSIDALRSSIDATRDTSVQ